MPSPYEMTKEARKLIAKWSKIGLCVYIRPLSSAWALPKEKVGQYWVVSVEANGLPYRQERAEGRSLSGCIEEIGSRLTTSYGSPGANPGSGWLAPEGDRSNRLREESK